MVEAKKTEAKTGPAPAPPVLARAAESGDPAVHQLLGELQTARLNGDQTAVQALTEKLAALGYE